MTPNETPPVRFEQALGELEEILHQLEGNDTSLEDALARYERGVGLIRQCHRQLKDVEQKIHLLAGVKEDGKADLRPFDHVASIEIAKSSVRRTRDDMKDSGIPG